MDLNPTTGNLMRKQNRDTDTYTGRRRRQRLELTPSEPRYTEDCQEPPEAGRGREDPPLSLQREPGPAHAVTSNSGPQTVRGHIRCCQAARLRSCYSSHGKFRYLVPRSPFQNTCWGSVISVPGNTDTTTCQAHTCPGKPAAPQWPRITVAAHPLPQETQRRPPCHECRSHRKCTGGWLSNTLSVLLFLKEKLSNFIASNDITLFFFSNKSWNKASVSMFHKEVRWLWG